MHLAASSCIFASLPNPIRHYLQRRKIVSWLLSSWDPNSATADPLLKATPSGSTPGSQTLASSPPVSCFPRSITCFAYLELEANSLHNGISVKTSTHPIFRSCDIIFFQSRPKQNVRQTVDGIAVLQTKGVMVFRVTPKGNAVYTQDIGDLTIFISKAEAFCVRASSRTTSTSLSNIYMLLYYHYSNGLEREEGTPRVRRRRRPAGSARCGRGLGLGHGLGLGLGRGLGSWVLGLGSWVLGLGGGSPAQ
ncbi:hypothetical protein F2Q70_00013797 [Brassica cretica]|uniref:Uncharacterized protein n=1 Tax=Brassica cretica TaxID=69181 RepID=A0A8S9LZQ0_BRACR|nr:hypothetical protein F2Q70_00013797 [Brassica cretica]